MLRRAVSPKPVLSTALAPSGSARLNACHDGGSIRGLPDQVAPVACGPQRRNHESAPAAGSNGRKAVPSAGSGPSDGGTHEERGAAGEGHHGLARHEEKWRINARASRQENLRNVRAGRRGVQQTLDAHAAGGPNSDVAACDPRWQPHLVAGHCRDREQYVRGRGRQLEGLRKGARRRRNKSLGPPPADCPRPHSRRGRGESPPSDLGRGRSQGAQAPLRGLARVCADASAVARAGKRLGRGGGRCPAIFRHSRRAKRNRGHVEAPPAPPWPPCPAPHMPVVRNKLALSLASTKAPVSADRRRTRASRQGTVAETNARRSNCAAQRHNHLHSVSSAASASIANRSRDICSAESVSTASMASRPNWLP